jgi:hypothetical protein
MNTFASILDRPASEIEAPKAMPVGTYVCSVQGLPKYDKTRNGNEYAEFTFKYLRPFENDDGESDVDLELLEAMGGVRERVLKNKFWLGDDSTWRLKQFLIDHLQIEEEPNSTLRHYIDQSPGRQFLVTIKHVPSEDGKQIYANVAGTAAIG